MKKALLIVDVQTGFINKHTNHLPKLVEKLQYDFDNVFIAKFHNEKGSCFENLLDWDGMQKGTDEVDLAFAMKYGAKIFSKNKYSKYLDEMGDFDEIYLCGICTDICVLKTALDLFEKGIRPVVYEDLCASTAGDVLHKAGLDILRRNIGERQVVKSNIGK